MQTRYRTPEEYLHRAKMMQRTGSPYAMRAMREAALAYATSEAAKRGDMALAAKGLAGLRAMALADPPVVLDRAAIQAKFAQLARAQADANGATLRTAAAIVGVVMPVLQLAGQAIGNPADRAVYATVLQVVQFAVSSAAGTPSSMPTLSSDAILGLVSFCGVWGGMRTTVQSGVDGLATATALSDRSAAAAIQTIGRVVVNVADGLCSDSQVRAAMPSATPANPPSSCWDPCPSSQYHLPDPTNPGQCLPCAPLTPDRSPRRVWEIVARARFLQEGLMLLPRPTSGEAQRTWDFNWLRNCATSCGLEWAERQYQQSIGGGPIPELRPIPASASPRRYFNPRTAPPSSCNCAGTTGAWGDGSAGGGGSAAGGGIVAAAAAIPLLFYFFR